MKRWARSARRRLQTRREHGREASEDLGAGPRTLEEAARYKAQRNAWWNEEAERCLRDGAALRQVIPRPGWNQLSRSAKVAAANAAAQVLCSRWDIDDHPVVFEHFDDASQHGVCEDTPPRIRLAWKLLDDAGALVTALAQELRHGYQNAVLSGTLPHPLGDEGLRAWREAEIAYDAGWFLNQYSNELEWDAENAEEAVLRGYLDG